MRMLIGLPAAMALLIATSVAEAVEGNAIKVASYYDGKQLCAIDTAGSSPVTLKCCPTATHDISVRRRYNGPLSSGRVAFLVRVTCVPSKDDPMDAKITKVKE